MSANWTLAFERRAEKDLARLGAQDRQRVLAFLNDRLLAAPSPRSLGAALRGPLGELWKYRVGDIRIIADLRAVARCSFSSSKSVTDARSTGKSSGPADAPSWPPAAPHHPHHRKPPCLPSPS